MYHLLPNPLNGGKAQIDAQLKRKRPPVHGMRCISAPSLVKSRVCAAKSTEPAQRKSRDLIRPWARQCKSTAAKARSATGVCPAFRAKRQVAKATNIRLMFSTVL